VFLISWLYPQRPSLLIHITANTLTEKSPVFQGFFIAVVNQLSF